MVVQKDTVRHWRVIFLVLLDSNRNVLTHSIMIS